MRPPAPHKIYRDANAPWWELRVSADTGDCYRPHTHDEYSIGIVDSGSSTFHHPAGSCSIGQGSVVLVEPHVVHACNPAAQQRWSYRMLFIDAAWLHQAMSRHWATSAEVTGLEFLARSLADPALQSALDSLCQPTSEQALSLRLQAELPPLLAGLARPAAAASPVRAVPELAPAETLLKTESGGQPSVGALADACGMTPSRFIRQFRKVHGMTPGDYMQDKRVRGARRLIGQGMPISEAAYAMGFADQAHLQRAFKAHHAMTPGHYQGN